MSDEAPHQSNDAKVTRGNEFVETRLVVWYFLAGPVFLFTSMLGGILMALQLVHWNPLCGIELFSPGRWRMVQTNAAAYGFLANAFFGGLHWAIPRLTLKPVLSRPLSYFIFLVWQTVVLATVVGILADYAQGIEWGETPVFVDPLALAALSLVSMNFMAPILQSRGPLSVSLCYFITALVWTPLTYAMGNFMPQYFISGTSAGVVGGLFIQDLIGLFFAPLGWGLMYCFVPIVLEKPIWNRRLSLIGFWGLAFFCPLCGIRHFLYSPIPMFLQYTAVVATVAFELAIAAAIVNFLGTIWGTGRQSMVSLPIRWIYTGMILCFVASLQGALQVMPTLQAFIHFSDWDVGHEYVTMFGVFTFWVMGFMTYLFPQLWRRSWHCQALCHWHYWLSTVGIVLLFGDLLFVGTLQGYWWASLMPWDASIDRSRPFWVFRLFAELTFATGQLCFVYNIYRTWKAPLPAEEHVESAAALV